MTIKEIAIACGVSPATVDRVLNGRGRVKPETEKKIRKALQHAGYSKNLAARALAIRKATPVVGIVLSSDGNPFFDDVLHGIHHAESELADYGLTVKLSTMRGYNVQKQLALMKELESEISALVLHPIDDSAIETKVADFSRRGIPTVTVNSDLQQSLRRCYVGSHYRKSGQTAAGIMRLATQGQGRLGILTGVESLQGHRHRLSGFENHIRTSCPGITIVAQKSAHDDDEQAYAATRAMLRADPTIDTILLIAAGLNGVSDAIKTLGMEERIRLFAFDNIPTTRTLMEQGLLKAAICQQPFQQGYQSVRAAMDLILSGEPMREHIYMENQILIPENLDG